MATGDWPGSQVESDGGVRVAVLRKIPHCAHIVGSRDKGRVGDLSRCSVVGVNEQILTNLHPQVNTAVLGQDVA